MFVDRFITVIIIVAVDVVCFSQIKFVLFRVLVDDPELECLFVCVEDEIQTSHHLTVDRQCHACGNQHQHPAAILCQSVLFVEPGVLVTYQKVDLLNCEAEFHQVELPIILDQWKQSLRYQ